MHNLRIIAVTLLSAVSVSGQVNFAERAAELNMGDLDFSSGVAIVDFNNDTKNEIIVVNLFYQNRLYSKQDSIFDDLADIYDITYTEEYHDISMVDVNFDYKPDFYITGCSYIACGGKFYINQAPAPFIEMSEPYNLNIVNDMSAAFFQMNRDMGMCVLAGRRLMMLQDNRFFDITQGSGLEGLTNVFCPVFFDIDGDIDDDLFIAGNWELNSGTLFRNNGDGTFTDISFNTNEGGFGYGQNVTYGDIDNDGDFDIYLTSGFGTNTMWQNDGSGYFTNITDLSNTGCAGYSRGSNFADFDNDCDLDLFINRATDYKMLYLNNGDGTFIDASEESGIDDFAGGFGCAVGDLDNNGQMDIIAANSDFVSKQVYLNLNSNSSYIKVKVVGQAPNTLAIGAIVQLYGEGDPTIDTELLGTREISSHASVYCVNEPIVNFGTGDNTDLRLVIRFPSSAFIDTSGIIPGQTIILQEPLPTATDSPKILLPKNHIVLTSYPNPFNNYCLISINCAEFDKYSLAIYDLLGRKVRTAEISGEIHGTKTFLWDGTDSEGQPLPTGVYNAVVQADIAMARIKITLLK